MMNVFGMLCKWVNDVCVNGVYAGCTHTLLWGSANILVKISHSLFNSTRLQIRENKQLILIYSSSLKINKKKITSL